uniref:RNA exonuclease 4 n=1 Tax=Ditylum brightwellii TaxID=49249 RepID=A0A7S2E957_9STRA|mmetsp:Transcript_20079/g.29917  ORF Transcript_20079/g.29917 Transcript_20079/m.29917 type:complete len:514 (+) Transcript_20079:191-1732(+)
MNTSAPLQCQSRTNPITRKRAAMRSSRPHSPSSTTSTATTVSSSSSSSTSSPMTGGAPPVSPVRGKIIHLNNSYNQQQRDPTNNGRGSSGHRSQYSPPRRQQKRQNKNKNPPLSQPGTVLRNKYTGSIHDAPMSKRDIYFALDCEMVGVGPEGLDSAVARVTVVNWEEEIVLDTFVKVPVPVTDYRTFVSGITKEDIDEASSAVSLQECREAVMTLLRGKILIGHALQNDLQALGINHPWTDTRDTATYPPYMKDHVDFTTKEKVLVPRKLRDLSWEKLQKQIQYGGRSHCPVEDAVAALNLYKVARTEWEMAMIQWQKVAREEEESRKKMREQVVMESMVRHTKAMEIAQRETIKARAQAAQQQLKLQQVPMTPVVPPGFHKQQQRHCSHYQQRQQYDPNNNNQSAYSPPNSPPHQAVMGQRQLLQQQRPFSPPNAKQYYTRLPPQMTPVSPTNSPGRKEYYNHGYPPPIMGQKQQHVPHYHSRARYAPPPLPHREMHYHNSPTAAPTALHV